MQQSSIPDEDEELEQPTKRIALQESNISRYHQVKFNNNILFN
jgi:hypothetical protein